MTGTIRRLHIYCGLLVFSQLAVYGLAGLAATFAPRERPKTASAVRYAAFRAPAGASDREVARLVYERLRLPLARPMPDWFLQHTPEGHLLLDFYNANGIWRVTVLENEGRVRIESIRNNLWLFLEDIHAATPQDREAPPLVRAWAVWNELGMWALAAFLITGVWMWLAARPRFAWAWAALACGAASLAALWVVFRR